MEIFEYPVNRSSKFIGQAKPLQYVKEGNCWLLVNRHVCVDGYCKLQVDGVEQRAHRYVFQQNYGEIPTGLLVMHSCDNPLCINPDHLKLGTEKNNAFDMTRKGRSFTKQKGNLGIRKLSPEAVELVKSRKYTRKQLMEMLNISHSVIYNIRAGKYYKD